MLKKQEKKEQKDKPGLKSVSPGLSLIARAIQSKMGTKKKFLGKKTNG